MWGDPDDYKNTAPKSDVPDSMPLGTWLIYVGLAMFAALGLLYWQYGVTVTTTPARAIVEPVPIGYRITTLCGLTDGISCNESTLTSTKVKLVLLNTNKWDIVEGVVSLTSNTGNCEFDGAQSLRLFPAGGSQEMNFTCADDTSFFNASLISNNIRIEYRRGDEPLTKYALGSINRSSVAVYG